LPLQYYLLETDDNPGTAAETDSRDLPRSGVIKALIFDVTAQNNGTSTGDRITRSAQIDQFRIGVVESNRISEIDGEDLDAFNVLRGCYSYMDNGIEDNERISFGFTYPLDPFMIGPNLDFSQPFGLSGSVGRKIEFVYAGDATTDAGLQMDDTRMAIGAIVRTGSGTGGYLSFHRDAYTAAAGGVNNFTDVPQPGKLVGVFNFEATNFGEITVDGDHRTTQTIREQSIAINRKDILGPVYTTMSSIINGAAGDLGSGVDEGYSFWNLGINNSSGDLGIPSAGAIPNNMEIRSAGGAATAARVHAVTLNTNT